MTAIQDLAIQYVVKVGGIIGYQSWQLVRLDPDGQVV